MQCPSKSIHPCFFSLEFGGLCLCIYVDDFILTGKEEHHGPFWKKLGEHIMIDDIGDLGRFLGRHHCTIEYEGQPMFAFDMREYARTIISDDDHLRLHRNHRSSTKACFVSIYWVHR